MLMKGVIYHKLYLTNLLQIYIYILYKHVLHVYDGILISTLCCY